MAEIDRADAESLDANQLGPPDYEFWARMAGWTCREGAALVLGLDPDRITKALRLSVEAGATNQRDTPIAKYQPLTRLLRRAYRMGVISSPELPKEFIKFVDGYGYKMPEELSKLVNAGKPFVSYKKRYFKMRKQRDEARAILKDQKEFPDRSKKIRSYSRLIYGIAKDRFRYDSNNPKNSATTSIKGCLDRQGVRLDDDTIRKILKECAAFVESDS